MLKPSIPALYSHDHNVCDGAVLPMLPGPVAVPPAVLEAMSRDLDAGHTEDDHLQLYTQVGSKLQSFLGTKNDIVLMSGEGMLALWSTMKSLLQPGDAVLCADTGVFGAGFADMAASLGCRAEKLDCPPNHTLQMADHLTRLEAAIKRLRPKMIVAVHCETPSGTLNPLLEVGRLKKTCDVPLFCVDAVASVGGAPVLVDEWHVDVLMGGTQKCLSAPPSLSFMAVSPKAWEIAGAVGYQGYDALLPFRKLAGDNPFPYTPYRQGTAALDRALDLLLAEGPDAVFTRHEAVAEQCRQGVTSLGLELFPAPGAVNSPTVTAVKVPSGIAWKEWTRQLRCRGLVPGGSFGPMAGKVFRLGHMGYQADAALIDAALKVLAAVV